MASGWLSSVLALEVALAWRAALKLGFDVAQSSVAKYMIQRPRPPSQGWGTFLRNHAPDIAAMDLLIVPTIGFDLLYALVIIRLQRRELVWINVTTHPTAEWIACQITAAFPWDEENIIAELHVRYWHKADMMSAPQNVLSFPKIISGRIGDAAQPRSEWRQWCPIVGLFDEKAHLSVMPGASALDCNTPHRRKEFAAGAPRRR